MKIPTVQMDAVGIFYTVSAAMNSTVCTCSGAIMPVKSHLLYGTQLLDHLAADGVCLAGGQVIGVAALRLLGCLHPEAAHDLPGLGDIDPVVIELLLSFFFLFGFRKKESR